VHLKLGGLGITELVTLWGQKMASFCQTTGKAISETVQVGIRGINETRDFFVDFLKAITALKLTQEDQGIFSNIKSAYRGLFDELSDYCTEILKKLGKVNQLSYYKPENLEEKVKYASEMQCKLDDFLKKVRKLRDDVHDFREERLVKYKSNFSKWEKFALGFGSLLLFATGVTIITGAIIAGTILSGGVLLGVAIAAGATAGALAVVAGGVAGAKIASVVNQDHKCQLMETKLTEVEKQILHIQDILQALQQNGFDTDSGMIPEMRKKFLIEQLTSYITNVEDLRKIVNDPHAVMK